MVFLLYLLAIVFFILLDLFIVFFLVLPVIKGALFVPSLSKAIESIVELAELKPGRKLVDLGAGDGRLMIALAKNDVKVYGYEINPFLILWAKLKIKKAGLKDKVFIFWRNFWNENLNSFDVVVIFGIGYIMKDLESKLRKELKPGAKVISNAFSFPSWQPVKKLGSIYLYIR